MCPFQVEDDSCLLMLLDVAHILAYFKRNVHVQKAHRGRRAAVYARVKGTDCHGAFSVLRGKNLEEALQHLAAQGARERPVHVLSLDRRAMEPNSGRKRLHCTDSSCLRRGRLDLLASGLATVPRERAQFGLLGINVLHFLLQRVCVADVPAVQAVDEDCTLLPLHCQALKHRQQRRFEALLKEVDKHEGQGKRRKCALCSEFDSGIRGQRGRMGAAAFAQPPLSLRLGDCAARAFFLRREDL